MTTPSETTMPLISEVVKLKSGYANFVELQSAFEQARQEVSVLTVRWEELESHKAEAPGVYGSDFAEAGYELAERIGFGGAVTLDGGRAGTHAISASAFRRRTASSRHSASGSGLSLRLG